MRPAGPPAWPAGRNFFSKNRPTPDGLTSIFNMLNDLVKWTNRDGFSGTLGEVGLPNIIQMECLEGNSLIVEVRNSQTDGEIYIKAGAIIHASTGRLAGEKAFHQLLSLTSGEFCLKPFREPPEHTLQGQWESLLAEAARARDKGNFSTGEDETILIVKKPAKGKSAPAAAILIRTRQTCTAAETTPDRTAPSKARTIHVGHEFYLVGRNGGGRYHLGSQSRTARSAAA